LSLYDTRFFFEHYYSSDEETLRKTRAELKRRGRKYVSSVTIHEVYKLTLEREGRETAKLRVSLIEKDFEVVPVDAELAELSAELRHRYRVPMADSIIAATAKLLNIPCVTDDPHIREMRGIRTRWI